jgi:ribosomal protein S18 acetylase RimI-like enzyme
LLASGETKILLAGEPAAGLALLRFRPALWSAGLECYLAELYVAPEQRGQGLGRALMEAAIELARGDGADTMDLNTAVGDRAARALYESLGFDNRGGHPEEGAANLYYELEL